MVKENKKNKTPETKTAQAELENKTSKPGDYTGYFYNQIERLWHEVMVLQQENNELRATIKGEY